MRSKGALVGLILASCLFTGSSSAALTSKQSNKVKHATSMLDQLDKRLSEANSAIALAGDKGTTEVIKQRVEQKLTQSNDFLSRAKDDLSELPASEPEVKAVLDRVDTSARKIADVDASFRNQSNKSASESDALKSAIGDGSALAATQAVFTDLFGINGDFGQPEAELARWPRARADFQKLEASIGDSLARARNSGAGMAASQFVSAKNAYERVQGERQKLVKDGPARVDAHLAKAEKAVAALSSSTGANMFAEQQALSGALNNAERVAATYEAMCNDLAGFQSGLPAKVKSKRAQLDAEMGKHRDRIIAANVPIASTYTGTDRSTIEGLVRDAWKRDFPTEKILAIRFPWGWERKTGWEWKDTRWEKHDVSTFTVAVYVEGENRTHAIMRRGGVKRWHLEGNKLTSSAYVRSFATPLVTDVVLASKL